MQRMQCRACTNHVGNRIIRPHFMEMRMLPVNLLFCMLYPLKDTPCPNKGFWRYRQELHRRVITSENVRWVTRAWVSTCIAEMPARFNPADGGCGSDSLHCPGYDLSIGTAANQCPGNHVACRAVERIEIRTRITLQYSYKSLRI